MYNEPIIKKKKKIPKGLFIMLTVFGLVLTLGLTYAYFIYEEQGNSHELIAGSLYMNSTNSGNVSLTGLYPMTNKDGIENGIKYNFTVEGHNLTDKDIYYGVYVNKGSEVANKTRFKDSDIKLYLTETINNVTKVVYGPDTLEEFNRSLIYAKTIDANLKKENAIDISYELTMWLDQKVLISDTITELEGRSIYTSEQFKNSYASIKLEVYGDFEEKKMPVRLNIQIENILPLTEPDVDGTRFVYGNTVDTNYVWYSGKLWRIVSLDEDGNIKLVTQGNMTTIAWDTSSSNTDYSTSQIRRWLNNNNDDGFLKSLHNAENLLIDYEWDYTTYAGFPTQKAKENVMKLEGENTEKVGLLNIYEFMMTGGNTSLSTSKTFLNNGYYWWTMSPKTSGSNVWLVSNAGIASNNGPTNSHGARPSVNLKSGITILGGTGEKTNPYTIEGDKATGTTSELLSNRISGEYINFNDTKYRIVGIETINGQQLTKVTMADYDDNKKNVLTTSIAFGNSSSDGNYNTSTGIGKYLLDWYNATEESDVEGTYAGLYISETYKKMIATSGEDGDGVYWWIGPGTTTRDYTLSKSGTTIATPIGLGYYGEIFSSQFGEGYGSSTHTWLMTKYDGSSVRYVYNRGNASSNGPTNSYGARPSFYLKSNVVIGDTNGDGKVGTGTPHDPYEIVQLTE